MKHSFSLFFIAIIGLSSCNMPKEKADLIVTNAVVYTIDSNFSTTEAFAVKDGRFVATGSSDEILKTWQADRLIDAGGATVVPGLNDGHCHFYGLGELLFRYADLTGSTSFEEVIQRLKIHNEKHPTEWLLGRGWDQNLWPGQQFPDNRLLEQHFPGKKILLIRIDGHASLASKTVLEMAGITAQTHISGGEVVLDKTGNPTGVLIDNANDSAKAFIPALTETEKEAALREAQQQCFAVGLTSVTDAGLPAATIALIKKMQHDGRLLMRVNAMADPDEATLSALLPNGPYSDDRLSVRSVKLYADGALGSRGALMKKSYSDAPGRLGLMMHDTAFYRNVMKRAYDAGFQVNTHAIGDAAVHLVLSLYAEQLQGTNDRRWRIEHAQVVDQPDFALFGRYNIIPSIQSTHATSDMGWAGERLGSERLKGAYAQQQLLEQNGWLVNGTDFPIESINPMLTFYAAVFRKDLNGRPEGGFQPENALSRQQALRSITIWPAKGAFEEEVKGSIEAGKWADFVILSADPMLADETEVPEIKPLQVFSAGIQVYEAK